jgi:hypothetical protein
MMVLRCVSSKSKVCELMPLSSAALAMSTFSPRPSDGGLRRGLQHLHGGQRGLDRFVPRRARPRSRAS